MKALREAAYQRAGGRCEVSGIPLDIDTFDLHHRRPKGMGGTLRPDTDTLGNVLALHPDVHNGGPSSVHGRRGWSEERGYLLPQREALAARWPVWLHGQRWVILGAAGGYITLGHASPPGSAEPGGD